MAGLVQCGANLALRLKLAIDARKAREWELRDEKDRMAAILEYAQKGLDLETGDAEAKAMFYYQLGVAQVGKGDTAAACESFKNAVYGPFAEAAKAQRTNLKCQ